MGNQSQVTRELIDRLTYHVGTSQILDGVTFYATPIVATDGKDSLPNIRLVTVNEKEIYRPTRGVYVQLNYLLHCAVKRSQPSGSFAFEELDKLVEKVKDALETETDGTTKPNLNGTLKPLDIESGQTIALDLSVTRVLSVNVDLKPAERGRRRI